MALPNFFVVGAQKAGTTSLYHYLAEHKDICLPEQKETQFFVNDELYAKGLEFYKTEYFSNCTVETAIGDVDPNYMYFATAVERIDSQIHNPKFIFILRNPVDRAFSHYIMSFRRSLEPYTFEDAIRKEEERITQGYFENNHYSYVRRGIYHTQIARFLKKWGRSNLHFILAEDLNNNPIDVMRGCFEFLGVDSSFVPNLIGKRFHGATIPKNMAFTRLILGRGRSAYPKLRRIAKYFVPRLAWRNKIKDILLNWNSKPSDLRLKNETRQQLAEIYRPENDKLSIMIERDLSHWNQTG